MAPNKCPMYEGKFEQDPSMIANNVNNQYDRSMTRTKPPQLPKFNYQPALPPRKRAHPFDAKHPSNHTAFTSPASTYPSYSKSQDRQVTMTVGGRNQRTKKVRDP